MSEGSEGATVAAAAATPEHVTFHYIKSNFFRVVHSDGVHGGVTPSGDLLMDFFSERLPIPQSIVNNVEKDGSIGAEVREERIQRQGLVREVDVGVVVSLKFARKLHAWLGEKIVALEAHKKLVGE